MGRTSSRVKPEPTCGPEEAVIRDEFLERVTRYAESKRELECDCQQSP